MGSRKLSRNQYFLLSIFKKIKIIITYVNLQNKFRLNPYWQGAWSNLIDVEWSLTRSLTRPCIFFLNLSRNLREFRLFSKVYINYFTPKFFPMFFTLWKIDSFFFHRALLSDYMYIVFRFKLPTHKSNPEETIKSLQTIIYV